MTNVAPGSEKWSGGLSSDWPVPPVTTLSVETVLGPKFYPDGITLMHEHLYFDLGFALNDEDLVLRDTSMVVGALSEAAAAGLGLVVDATTVDQGRNVWALADISRRSGVDIVATTGFYRGLTMAPYLSERSSDAWTQQMISEILDGIEGSAIRAGAIGEIGTEGEAFLPVERTNFVAAAAAQQETGVAILTHTPAGRFGVEQARLLIDHGADPAHICIGHVDCNPDIDYYAELVDLGVWLGFDRAGVHSYAPDETRWATLAIIAERGWLSHVVISGDVARRSRFADGSGAYRYAFTSFWDGIEALSGNEDAYRLVFIENPRVLLGQPSKPNQQN